MREPLEIKYIIKIKMKVYGSVDQSDIIGAIFGQTEDVLGETLDLRELQRKNKIGRIDVEIEPKKDHVQAIVTIPSGLEKTESVIIAATLETIKKIGPCKAEALVDTIENIKKIKTRQIIEKAKEVLQKFMSITIDSQELVDKVVAEVRKSEMVEYGKDKLLAGPSMEKSDEIIIVETKQDLLNMLVQGIKNGIAVEDKYNSPTLKELADKKVITVLINRGKEYIVRNMMENFDIDHFTKPESGTRVSDMQSKEIFKAIRSRVSTKQLVHKSNSGYKPAATSPSPVKNQRPMQKSFQRPSKPIFQKRETTINEKEASVFKKKLGELKNSNDACIVDKNLETLGEVPVKDVASTIQSLGTQVYAIIMKTKIPNDIITQAENSRIRYVVGTGSERTSTKVRIITNI